MRRFGFVGWALLLSLIVATLGWPYHWPDYGSDPIEYRTFAITGDVSHVHRQFAGRILHPLAVHFLWKFSGVGLDQAFLIVAVAALLIFTISMSALLAECGVPASLIVPLLCTPFLVDQFWRIYSQGLLQWTFIALFFLSLRRDQVWIAAALLMLAYLTRESAMILAAAMIAIGCVARSLRMVLASVIAASTAFAITSSVALHALPNLHHVSGFTFLVFKLPFEFARNVLGLTIVPNTLMNSPGNDCTPILRMALPGLFRVGGLSWVSYCGFNARRMLTTLSVLMDGFGIGPAALLAAFARGAKLKPREMPWLAIAVLFGIIAYLLGTSEGTALFDEIGSGWPAFWIGAPVLIAQCERIRPDSLVRLLTYNLVVSWMLSLVARATTMEMIVLLAISLAFDLLAYMEMIALDPAPLLSTTD